MNSTINTGAISQGFNALANALAPNYQGMIEADLARYRRDNIQADTRYRDAMTAGVGATTERTQADNAALAAARAALAAGVTDPNALGAIFAGAMGDPAAMGQTPGFVTGYRTTVDPTFTESPTFSGVLTGTGVQTYPNTPAGQAASLEAALTGDRMQADSALAVQASRNEGDLAVQESRNEGDLAVARITPRSGANPAGAPSALDEARVYALAEGALPKGADPQIVASVAADAMELVRTGKAPSHMAAVQLLLSQGYTPSSDPWGWGNAVQENYASPLAGILGGGTAGTPADNAPAAAPVAPAGAGGGGQTAQEGQHVRDPQGNIYVVRGGQLVPVQ